jgi:hypothetical protein
MYTSRNNSGAFYPLSRIITITVKLREKRIGHEMPVPSLHRLLKTCFIPIAFSEMREENHVGLRGNCSLLLSDFNHC